MPVSQGITRSLRRNKKRERGVRTRAGSPQKTPIESIAIRAARKATLTRQYEKKIDTSKEAEE